MWLTLMITPVLCSPSTDEEILTWATGSTEDHDDDENDDILVVKDEPVHCPTIRNYAMFMLNNEDYFRKMSDKLENLISKDSVNKKKQKFVTDIFSNDK